MHEGATFAGVMRAPAILFCNNNQWAISTPLSEQTAAPTLADKAIGYGMPGVRVDGGDVLAVYEATRDAVDARSSRRRPDLHRSRVLPGRTACDRGRSVDLHRPRARRGGETERVRRALRALPPTGRSPLRRGAEAVRAEALELMRAGIATAEAEPAADPALVFEHAYADPPASQAHDLAELRRMLGWLSSSSSRP